MQVEEVLRELESLGNLENRAGMARFGINTEKAYGVSVTVLRRIAKRIGRDHALAQQLWESSVHEARILATLVDDSRQVTEEQVERWVRDFDSWDLCDQCCINLFNKTPFAYAKAREWSVREEEFVRRAGFALMAVLAVHDKKAADEVFLTFLPLTVAAAGDERNFVKKAVNWSLRQTGKRNARLNAAAIATAREIQSLDSRAARWIAADALRELQSAKVQERLGRRP